MWRLRDQRRPRFPDIPESLGSRHGQSSIIFPVPGPQPLHPTLKVDYAPNSVHHHKPVSLFTHTPDISSLRTFYALHSHTHYASLTLKLHRAFSRLVPSAQLFSCRLRMLLQYAPCACAHCPMNQFFSYFGSSCHIGFHNTCLFTSAVFAPILETCFLWFAPFLDFLPHATTLLPSLHHFPHFFAFVHLSFYRLRICSAF